MARRSKPASRRDRQRRARNAPPTTKSAAPRPLPGVISEAVDAAASDRLVAQPATRAASAPSMTRGARPDPRYSVAGPSRLTERAAAEYHYVARDLRNIGVLVAIMAVVLLVAVIAFNAMGIGAH
jgi:hypothetical protein